MVYYVQTKRSDTPNKRPLPTELLDGQLAVNFDTATAGLFFKNDTGGICKAGPTAIGALAPAPTEGGATQLGVGEMWLDTSNSAVNALKVWNGTAWIGVGPTGDAGGGGGGDVTIGLWTQQNFKIFPTAQTVKIFCAPGLLVGGTTDNPRLQVDGPTGNLTTLGDITTSDLNMSNLQRDSGNEVDGTKGHWTLQEGADNLYIINRRTGQKYSIMMREVN